MKEQNSPFKIIPHVLFEDEKQFSHGLGQDQGGRKEREAAESSGPTHVKLPLVESLEELREKH